MRKSSPKKAILELYFAESRHIELLPKCLVSANSLPRQYIGAATCLNL